MGEFTDHLAKKAKGSQGKPSETAVQSYLKAKGEADKTFDWHRAYDARAAGGVFQRIAGDFSFYSPGVHGIIEVKETQFDNRLPYKNFEHHQVGKAVVRKLAGGRVLVLIFSTSTKFWRWFPIEFFQHRDSTKGIGSWFFPDARQTYASCDEILGAFFDDYLPIA